MVTSVDVFADAQFGGDFRQKRLQLSQIRWLTLRRFTKAGTKVLPGGTLISEAKDCVPKRAERFMELGPSIKYLRWVSHACVACGVLGASDLSRADGIQAA